MHHFVIELRHDGERITSALGWPVRWPWTSCLDSPAQLAGLVGEPLAPSPVTVRPGTNVREQCTHQFDLAVWAIGHAHRFVRGGPARREYVAVIRDFTEPPFRVELWRDRELAFSFETDGERVLDPGEWAGMQWRGGFIEWVRDHCTADQAEAALIVRRAVWLAPARRIDLEACDVADQSGLQVGVCYTSTPERLFISARNKGSLRDRSFRASTIAP
jgi:hypothetical protein